MKNLFNRFVREESGQDIIEYALLAAFISIVAWAIVQSIGTDVKSIYHSKTMPVTRRPRRLRKRSVERDRRTASAVRLSSFQ